MFICMFLLPLSDCLGILHLADTCPAHSLVVAEGATELCDPAVNGRVLMIVRANAAISADVFLLNWMFNNVYKLIPRAATYLRMPVDLD